MPTFNRRNLVNLSELLLDSPESVSPSEMRKVKESIDAVVAKYRISDARMSSLRTLVDDFGGDNPAWGQDVKLGMLRVLIFRYLKRTEGKGLFGDETDPEPNKPLKIDNSLREAARIHLFHRYNRPFYYGIDDLCDASSDNAEQFLRLAAKLVDRSAAELVRDRSPALPSRIQHRLLHGAAADAVRTWDFPSVEAVKKLGEYMGGACLKRSLEDNASLGAGANAFGIAQSEFESLAKKWPVLARVLHFGVAYNAFTVVPNYDCKSRTWCLIELGGIYKLYHGLTLMRGGFIESSAEQLVRVLAEED